MNRRKEHLDQIIKEVNEAHNLLMEAQTKNKCYSTWKVSFTWNATDTSELVLTWYCPFMGSAFIARIACTLSAWRDDVGAYVELLHENLEADEMLKALPDLIRRYVY